MLGRCPCGAPALEDGLCGFCLEHSPSVVRELVRRQRDKIALLEAELKKAREAVDSDRTRLVAGAELRRAL